MQKTRLTDHRQQGFSLLEIIIALGILTFGVSSAFALFGAATAAHKRAIDRTHAATIAEQAMADIESALFRGVEPQKILDSPPIELIAEYFPGYGVDIQFYVINSDELLLQIDVFWKYRGKRRSESFSQLVIASDVLRR